MTTPLISVIVPVYRVEEYLERCVKSILSQTYENLEVILVDDGSPDQCPAICDACAEKDARVKVIHQENKGLSGARNAGIDAASGEYLAFVDSDDYVSPHFIEELYQLLQDTGCAIGQCRFSYVKGDGLVETTYRFFHEAKKLAFLDRALYGYYTENGDSITSVFSAKRLQWLTAHEERIAFFKKNGYEKLLPAAYRKLCDACITFYFRCTEQVKDAEELKKELRKRLETYRANGAAWIAALPLKTRMGYELFSMSPGLYAKMLQKMQETS